MLCLGAHSDDIEIGAGGTLLQWQAAGVRLDVLWCVLSADGPRERGGPRLRGRLPRRAPSAARIEVQDFRDGYFPAQGAEIKDWFEKLKGASTPDLILTHRGDDPHQDHREVGRLTWNTFRDHLILEYEIPKWDGDLGRPNRLRAGRRDGAWRARSSCCIATSAPSAPSTGSTRRLSAAWPACAAWNAARPSASRRRSTPASWRLLEPQRPLQERQLRLQHGDDGLGLAEAVRLAGVLVVGDVDAARLSSSTIRRDCSGGTTLSSRPWNRMTGAVMPSIRLRGERAAHTSFHLAGVVPSRRCR